MRINNNSVLLLPPLVVLSVARLRGVEAFLPGSVAAAPGGRMVAKEPASFPESPDPGNVFLPRPPETSPPPKWLGVPIQNGRETTVLQKDGTTEIYFSAFSTVSPQLRAEIDSLVERMWAREQTLQRRRKQVQSLTDTRNERTREIDALKNVLREEADLKVRLSELQGQVEHVQDAEEKAETEYQNRVKDYKAMQKDLEEQMGGLQKDLVRAQMELRGEQQRYHALTQRLLEVEGTSDWEVEEFEKEKEVILTGLSLEQDLFANISSKLKAEEEAQKEGLVELRAQVDTITETVQQEQLRLELQREDHRKQRAELQEALRQQDVVIKKAKENLRQHQMEHMKDLENLEKAAEAEQQEYVKLKERTALQNLEFAELKRQLEVQLTQTVRTVEQWSKKWNIAQTRREWQQGFLQERMAAELRRLEMVREQLQKESLRNNNWREKWQTELDAQNKRTISMVHMMGSRFSRMRQRLMHQIRSAKTLGSGRNKSLLERYESDVAEWEEALDLWKESADFAHKSRDGVHAQLEAEEEVAKNAVTSLGQIEAQMRLNLDRASVEVRRLRKDRTSLLNVLDQQDADIERMESSLRAIAAASWRLTKDGASNIQRRVVRKVMGRTHKW